MEKRSGKKTMASCSEAKKASTRRRTTKAKEVPVVVLEDEDGDEATLTLSVQKDTLECEICVLPFEYQVFMCKNGHSLCASCCVRANGKCFTCTEPIGDIRCRALEKILETATTSCRFRRYGCHEIVRYTEKPRHEESCPRAPSDCPMDGCTYSGTRLYHHVVEDHAPDSYTAMGGLRGTTVTVHRAAPFRVLLQRDRERVFLLLNGRDLLQGRSLSLLCLGPGLENGDVELEYEMELSGGGGPGELSLSATGTVPRARRLQGFQAKGFLFVPDAYWGSSGTVSVKVRV